MFASQLHSRHAAQQLTEALEDSPVVLIHGPRQCGKTTLTQLACAPQALRWQGDVPAWATPPECRDYDYITLLERIFLLDRLPPWHSNRASRLVKSPKLHLGDTGLACALLGVDASALAKNRELLGQLLETFVLQELRRQASWWKAPSTFHHYRDKDKVEVAIVIERGALAVAGVEVKAGATVRDSDFRGLRKLAKASGSRFAGGAVLYDGEACVGFGDGLHAVPIRLLWDRSV